MFQIREPEHSNNSELKRCCELEKLKTQIIQNDKS